MSTLKKYWWVLALAAVGFYVARKRGMLGIQPGPVNAQAIPPLEGPRVIPGSFGGLDRVPVNAEGVVQLTRLG